MSGTNWRDKANKEAQLAALLELPLVEALKSETEMTDEQIEDDIMGQLSIHSGSLIMILKIPPFVEPDEEIDRGVFEDNFNKGTYDRIYAAVAAFAPKEDTDLSVHAITVQQAIIIHSLNELYISLLRGDEFTVRHKDNMEFVLALAERKPFKREWLAAALDMFSAESERGIESYKEGNVSVDQKKAAAEKEPQNPQEAAEMVIEGVYDFLFLVWDFRSRVDDLPENEQAAGALREILAEKPIMSGIQEEGSSLYLPDSICEDLLWSMKKYVTLKDFLEASSRSGILEVLEVDGDKTPRKLVEWFEDEYIPNNPELARALTEQKLSREAAWNDICFSEALRDGFFSQVVKLIAAVNKIDISKGYNPDTPGE
ncbi:MAG: hypothetical protein EB060_00460 [Proteobacteria bacterium]|nr:hypothetical protein [Pseudomonadota bacterium]